MNNNKEWRERRGWIILILIVPIGIVCMLAAGQTAIRMLPRWSVNADMGSNLNPNDGSAYDSSVGLVEPIKPNILTPAAWAAGFLTPHPGEGGSGTVVPFVVFTETATTTATVESSPTEQVTSTGTSTATSTPPPPVGTQPTTTKTKKPGSPTATTPAPTTVTPDPTTVTPDPPTGTPAGTGQAPVGASITPAPPNVNIGTPDANIVDGNGSGPNNFSDGSYFVVPLTVHVAATPDGNYDLVYYEIPIAASTATPATPAHSDMDQVIIGLSHNASGNPYYQVFNWGDGQPDINSNANTNTISSPVSPAETDNESVDATNLYDPPGPPSQGTGILIDVDQNTNGNPPPGDYEYVVIIAPSGSGSSDGGQLDAVDTVEVVLPP